MLSKGRDGTAPKDMMRTWLIRQLHVALDRRDAELEQLRTPQEVTAYQERVRHAFLSALGELPQRTPLQSQVVARECRDGYRIEKILFQSQPRHYVTAVLYLPASRPPYPGVLVPCGHTANGKAWMEYQQIGILLARNGMAALCYDPIDQGERYQLLDENGKPLPRLGGTTAHSLVGVGSILLGRNTATYRVWDGMRALDYLQSCPEIDSKKIGCTGNSGGGNLTSYLMALDERVLCAAPGCWLTSFHRLIDTIGPQDCEQNLHGQCVRGPGHADFVILHAPRPVLIAAATQDFFDIGGTRDSLRRAKAVYAVLRAAERLDMVEANAEHGFTKPLREATTAWMRRWLMDVHGDVVEPVLPVAADKDLQCTPQGQVMLPGARSVYDLNMEFQEKLAAERKRFWKKSGRMRAMEEVRRVTGIRRLGDLPQPKLEKLGELRRKGYRIDKLILTPEHGIWLPALAFVPEKRSGRTYLYVHQDGKEAHAHPAGPIENLAGQGHLVFAVDLRGIGETQGVPNEKFAAYLGPEWPQITLAYLLGSSYLAMRAEEMLVCARAAAGYDSSAGTKPVHQGDCVTMTAMAEDG